MKPAIQKMVAPQSCAAQGEEAELARVVRAQLRRRRRTRPTSGRPRRPACCRSVAPAAVVAAGVVAGVGVLGGLADEVGAVAVVVRAGLVQRGLEAQLVLPALDELVAGPAEAAGAVLVDGLEHEQPAADLEDGGAEEGRDATAPVHLRRRQRAGVLEWKPGEASFLRLARSFGVRWGKPTRR